MKSASPGYIARLELPEQSFCYLATIERRDGTVIRLADCFGDLTIDSEDFIGSPGFEVTSITSSSFGTPSSAEMSVPLDGSSPISATELQAGYYDGASVVIFQADYLSTVDGVVNAFRGKISQIEQIDANQADLRLSGFASELLEVIVETFGPDCRAPFLGHPRCGFDVPSVTHSAVVATVTDSRNFTLTITAPEAVDGWFANGAVEFTGGNNDGLAFDVRAWDQSSALVSLWLSPFGEVQVGDTLNIAPGCDKRASTCNDKFSNILNFQGFPLMPTNAQLICDDAAVPPPEEVPVGGTITVVC